MELTLAYLERGHALERVKDFGGTAFRETTGPKR